MDSVARPVKAFAISIGRVELYLELFDPLLASGETKDTFDVGCYMRESVKLDF